MWAIVAASSGGVPSGWIVGGEVASIVIATLTLGRAAKRWINDAFRLMIKPELDRVSANISAQVTEVHKRIDNHMDEEERELTQQREATVSIQGHVEQTSLMVRQVNSKVNKIDERLRLAEIDLARKGG